MTERKNGKKVAVPGRRSVWLGPYEDTGDFVIQFQRPIRKTDFQDGQVVPVAKAYRKKQSLFQQMRITPQTAHALWQLLDEHFNEVADTEATPGE